MLPLVNIIKIRNFQRDNVNINKIPNVQRDNVKINKWYLIKAEISTCGRYTFNLF